MLVPRSLGILAPFFLAAAATAQSNQPSPGVWLLDPVLSTDAKLIESDGSQVRSYRLPTRPGLVSYIGHDGNLIRAQNTGTNGPGFGGGIQRVASDGTILWNYVPQLSGTSHHDIEELPNGNVLMVVTDPFTTAEFAALGRDPSTMTLRPVVLSERIIEVEQTGPNTGRIVWEWRAADHLVQQDSPGMSNFGSVRGEPGKIHINWPPGEIEQLWIHMNSIDYNAELDQIVVSSRTFSELWIIDHSTTTAEAAGSTGGRSGRGGELLYRWGNPTAHFANGTRQLNEQHDVNWIPPGYPGAGNLICFNNRKGNLVGLGNASAITEMTPPPTDANGNYPQPTGANSFAPFSLVWEYFDPRPTSLFSAFMSSAQRLPNGNTLVCSSFQNRVFELGANDAIVAQRTANMSYKALHYPRSFSADSEQVSAINGGSAQFSLDAEPTFANHSYAVLGSVNGTFPGATLFGVHIPLRIDWYTTVATGSPTLPNSIGRLDANGRATAGFFLPAGAARDFVGLQMHHAFLVFDNNGMPVHASNALPLRLTQ